MVSLKKGWIGLGLSLVAIALTPSVASANTLLQRTCRLDVSDGTLQDGSRFDHHEFAGVAGQTVTILLESDDFDPYLIVEDSSGLRIGENDDLDLDNGNINALVALTLARNGVYSVYTSSYDDSGYGTYQLLVSSPTSVPQPTSYRPDDC